MPTEWRERRSEAKSLDGALCICKYLNCRAVASPLSRLPSNLSIDTSLHADSAGISSVLCMMRSKQVLPNYRQVQSCSGAPGESRICGGICSHLLGGQGTHIAKILIKGEFSSQIQRGLNEHLMVGTRALR